MIVLVLVSRQLKEKFSFHAALDNVWIHRNIRLSVSFVESFNQTRDFESDLGLNISFPQPFQARLHRVNDNDFPVLLFSSFEVVRILSE